MTLEELKDWVYELEDEIEKKVEWTLTDTITTSEARIYTQPFYLATKALKEKLDEMMLIKAFNDFSDD